MILEDKAISFVICNWIIHFERYFLILHYRDAR